MREAKQHTNWIEPDERHEAAVQSFAKALLTHREFLRDFEPFQRRVAEAGEAAALGQLLLKLTVPGIPDIYQGDELLCALARRPRQPPPRRLGRSAARRSPTRRRSST